MSQVSYPEHRWALKEKKSAYRQLKLEEDLDLSERVDFLESELLEAKKLIRTLIQTQDSYTVLQLQHSVEKIIQDFKPKYISDFKIKNINAVPTIYFEYKEKSINAIKEVTKLQILILEKLNKKILFSD